MFFVPGSLVEFLWGLQSLVEHQSALLMLRAVERGEPTGLDSVHAEACRTLVLDSFDYSRNPCTW